VNTKEIKKRMVDYGLTNAELADRIGVTPSHFSGVLNGKKTLTLGVANRIQKVLEIPDELFAFYFMKRDGEE
jgi:antitoxin component HigA of HigAB toxin-antitoxin module